MEEEAKQKKNKRKGKKKAKKIHKEKIIKSCENISKKGISKN